ncbi:MAG: low-specificity L-threonine aldolase [Granulosicoccus sp.]|nr:low-specificity L-threonine aldolase [Granulosicoccus sp.]
MSALIDIRSDTVTRPTAEMRAAMVNAKVGDDVYGDDPTVNDLQAFASDLTGHEAALFMPSGTQSNLVALLTHCNRGDEYIAGSDAHTFKYEGGGAAALGGIQPQTIEFDSEGGLDLEKVASVIKKDDVHFANTRLLCLENTQHGRVQSLARMQQSWTFAHEHQLKIHLDGARIANACVALNVSLREMVEGFDSVSICLSKGLGAPVGSLLLGNRDFIERARRWRKVTGGGLRQAGVLAAAGKLALTSGLARLQEDHDNARFVADKLKPIPGLSVRNDWTQTNMVWVDYARGYGELLSARAQDAGILMSAYDSHCRIVTHQDVNQEQLLKVADLFEQVFNEPVRAVQPA